MMIWMLWTLAVSLLLALSAALIERVAWYLGVARRYVWLSAMLIAAAAPLLLPAYVPSLPWRPAASARAPARAPARALARALNLGTTDQSTASSTAVPLASKTQQSFIDRAAAATKRAGGWIAAVWAAWSLALLVSLAWGLIQLRRRRSSWATADTEVGQVFVATDVPPAVIGWVRPRIVIPPWALAADASTRALVLRHELEHIRAGDTRALLLAEVLRRVFPWNAALWWMASRLRVAIEMDCDARVIRTTGAARAYGLMLLEVSERFKQELPLMVSSLSRRHDIERRLRVLGVERLRHPVAASIPYATVALIVLATAAWTPRPGFPDAHRAMTIAADSDLARVGYTQRKEGGFGVFMDGSQIARQSPLFSDAFRAVRGVTVLPIPGGRTNVIVSAEPAGGCVTIYVDGTRWDAKVPGDIDDFVGSADLLAVEAYRPASVPDQFAPRDQPRCETLVVWTQAIRRRRR